MQTNDTTITILSWTLTNENAPPIRVALESVRPIVDAHLAIWTGAVSPPLGWAPDAVGEAGPGRRTVFTRWWAWQNDYAAARNAALDLAANGFVLDRMTGNEWGLMLDTDERVICPDPSALRTFLASLPPSVCVALAHHEDGSHTRERFFRLPPRYKFTGRTHEMYPAREDEQAIVPPEIVRWSELAKTPEQLRAKFIRDVDMLREDIRENPKNGSAYYYLGASLQALAMGAPADGLDLPARAYLTEAIEAFREHRRIDTEGAPAWHEGTAFSCYRAAECYIALSQPDRALDCAVAGLALDAGIAELYWIAAVASLQVGRHEQARAWAESAKAHAMGSASERRRRGFRIPRGLREGPDEVLAFVREAAK